MEKDWIRVNNKSGYVISDSTYLRLEARVSIGNMYGQYGSPDVYRGKGLSIELDKLCFRVIDVRREDTNKNQILLRIKLSDTLHGRMVSQFDIKDNDIKIFGMCTVYDVCEITNVIGFYVDSTIGFSNAEENSV